MKCRHVNGRLDSTSSNCTQFRVADEGWNLPVVYSIARRMFKVHGHLHMWCSCSFIHVVMGHVNGLLIVKRREEKHLSWCCLL